MSRILIPSLLVFACSAAFGSSALQTDWSGGPGVPGPTTSWDGFFDSCENAGYESVPGSLLLSSPLGAHVIGDETDTPVAVILADFDGDGFDDAAAIGSSGLSWWRNTDGAGFDWEYHAISGEGAANAWLDASDIDADGDLDLVLSKQSVGLFWWENDGGGVSWTEHVIVEADVRECRCGDFDDDGMDDIVLMVPGTSDVMWWRNRLASSHDWSPEYIDGAFPGAYTCDPADMDGDGDLDLVAASYDSGEIRCYLRQPGGSWNSVTVTTDFEHPVCIRAADIDGDGLTDITGVCWSNGYLSWWRQPLPGEWEMHTLATDLASPSCVLPADMDNDGDIDILATAFNNANGLLWYDNQDGLGLTWVLVEAFSCYQAMSIDLGDLNGDGIEEIAAPSACQDLVRYWRTAGYESPGQLFSSIYDTGALGGIDWDYLHWDSEEPSGTDLRVAVRGSSDPSDMGPWSAWLASSTSLAGLLEPSDRYIQYTLELTTTDPWISPSLNDITFLWSTTGIETAPDEADPLVLIGPNPVRGGIQLGFHVPASGWVDLRIYDLTGREVSAPVSGWMENGSHSATVTGLPSGLYVCTYSASETRAQLQVVVVN